MTKLFGKALLYTVAWPLFIAAAALCIAIVAVTLVTVFVAGCAFLLVAVTLGGSALLIDGMATALQRHPDQPRLSQNSANDISDGFHDDPLPPSNVVGGARHEK